MDLGTILFHLPSELWRLIFHYCAVPFRVRDLSIVCVAWHTLVKESITSLCGLKSCEVISDDFIRQFPSLQELVVTKRSNVTNAGIDFVKLSLTSLDISNSKLVTDEAVAQCVNLKSLQLCGNIVITDAGISQLTNLSDLALRENCRITDSVFARLTNLTRLDLGNNDSITNEAVRNLTQLESLGLMGSCVAVTDDLIRAMPNLTFLDLKANNLISDNGLETCEKLLHLELSENDRIRGQNFWKLTNLTRLHIFNDSLSILESGALRS
jgi:Leucine-rich repeat (LRR) protein